MNIHDPNIVTPKVTTGALPASRKVYSRPETAPDLRVPIREIALTDAAGEPPVPVYDTTGPYTDPEVPVGLQAWAQLRHYDVLQAVADPALVDEVLSGDPNDLCELLRGAKPDAGPAKPGRPRPDRDLGDFMAGEQLLDEARAVSRRIRSNVWKLIRTDGPHAPDGPAPQREPE